MQQLTIARLAEILNHYVQQGFGDSPVVIRQGGGIRRPAAQAHVIGKGPKAGVCEIVSAKNT